MLNPENQQINELYYGATLQIIEDEGKVFQPNSKFVADDIDSPMTTKEKGSPRSGNSSGNESDPESPIRKTETFSIN